MIETKDLILSSGAAEDWRDLHKNLWGREEVFRYLFSRPCATEEAARKKTAAYAQMHREVETEFFVYEKTTSQAIGIAGIKELAPGQWTVTDIAIGPDFQGRGYGGQILRALVDLAFGERSAETVVYGCFAENGASKRLAESCGFVWTHAAEGELPKDGAAVIMDHYRIEKGDWK